MLAPFGIGLAFFIVGGAFVDLIERTGLGRQPPDVLLAQMLRVALLLRLALVEDERSDHGSPFPRPEREPTGRARGGTVAP